MEGRTHLAQQPASSYLDSDVHLLLSPSGSCHPVAAEYLPSPDYYESLREYVRVTAKDVATLTAILAEAVLREGGANVVLVSIARAGTPVGVLVKRWLAMKCGLDVPHFTISVASGLIDERALGWLCSRYKSEQIQFIDGWTSKGTVAGAVRRACRRGEWLGINPRLAVMVDPCAVAAISATREDILLPHACLGTQMSGLMSATQTSVIAKSDQGFHTVCFREDLQGRDLTRWYLDQVTARFGDVVLPVTTGTQDEGTRDLARLPVADLAAKLEVDPEKMNIGLSEAARALFRWRPTHRVVVRRRSPATVLLRLVAAQRGVRTLIDPTLPVEAVVV